MDKVIHFEIPVDDFARAEKFYSEVFDWKINRVSGFDYTLVNTAEVDEKMMPKEKGAINGGMLKRGQIKNIVITVNVQDVDNYLKKTVNAGGKIVINKFKAGDAGYSAYIQDTEGNVLGVWQNLKKNI